MRRLAERRSVILGYHGIGTAPAREDLFRLLVSPEQFSRQLELLLGAGFRFVTVAEFAEQLDGGGPPPGLATVSFDDGLRDNYTTRSRFSAASGSGRRSIRSSASSAATALG